LKKYASVIEKPRDTIMLHTKKNKPASEIKKEKNRRPMRGNRCEIKKNCIDVYFRPIR